MSGNDETTNLRNQLDLAERRVSALEAELARVRKLLDALGRQRPTGDAACGEGFYAMASKAGFHHSYGNSIWMGGKDCTESVYRLALMAAQAENEACAKHCETEGSVDDLPSHYADGIRERWEVQP